jgi:hypothetical protein
MLGSISRFAQLRLAMIVAGIAFGGTALAQDTSAPLVTPPSATAAAPGSAAPIPVAPASPSQAPRLSAARLDQLVAPVALYPDPLLAQLMMASTYPLEVVEAARWFADPEHRALTGDDLVQAVAAQAWDPSVKALIAFPDVLKTMSDRLEWTQDLGNAFLTQPAAVMAAVQRLRRQAMAAGSLKTTPQCDCTVEDTGGTIAIVPAEPEEVRVPAYAAAAYGPWPYADYPPDELPSPDQYACPPGYWLLCYGEPVDLAFFGPLWGWGWIGWQQNVIFVRPHRHRPVRVWVHDPAHRGGVRYADAWTRARFDAARQAALTTATREDAAAEGAMAVRPEDAEPLVVLRGDAIREFARLNAGATVLRGVPAAVGQGAAFPDLRLLFARIAPPPHAAPIGSRALRVVPAGGALHPAAAGMHGSGRFR